MKTLAALLFTFVIVASMSACDSTKPEPEIVKVHDTTFLNDRFAGKSSIVHGQWKFITSTDTGIAILFQNGDSISATVTWKHDGSKSLLGTVSAKSTLSLSDSSDNYRISGAFRDSSNHKITRISGQILDLVKFANPGTGKALDSLQAIRTF